MDLDIVILYVILSFLVTCLVARILLMSEGYTGKCPLLVERLPNFYQMLMIGEYRHQYKDYKRRSQKMYRHYLAAQPNKKIYYKKESDRLRNEAQSAKKKLMSLVKKINSNTKLDKLEPPKCVFHGEKRIRRVKKRKSLTPVIRHAS